MMQAVRTHAAELALHDHRHELRPVVRTDVGRRATGDEQVGHHTDKLSRAQLATDPIGQALARELGDNVRQAQLAATLWPALAEVVGPTGVEPLRPQPSAGLVIQLQLSAPRLPRRRTQALAAPDPLHPLVVGLQPSARSEAVMRQKPNRPCCLVQSMIAAFSAALSSAAPGTLRRVERAAPASDRQTLQAVMLSLPAAVGRLRVPDRPNAAGRRLALADQNLNLPQLGDNLLRLVILACHPVPFRDVAEVSSPAAQPWKVKSSAAGHPGSRGRSSIGPLKS